MLVAGFYPRWPTSEYAPDTRMDLEALTAVVQKLQAAGVVEIELDAKERLRRMVLRIPEAPAPTFVEPEPAGPAAPARHLYSVPPVKLTDAIADVVRDDGVPDLDPSVEEAAPVKAAG